MNLPETGARLTISALAARHFFDPETTQGLRVRTEDDVITFRASTSQRGSSIVSIEHRKRGGMSAMIDEGGSYSPDLFQLFRKAGYKTSEPFFILTKAPRGWVGIEHHPGGNPPITKPHIRVWMKDLPKGRKPTAVVADEEESVASPMVDWRSIRKILTDAKTVLGQRGRATADTMKARDQARKTFDQFERLVNAFYPDRADSTIPDHDALREAQDECQIAIAERDVAIAERDQALEEVQALHQLLEEPRTGRPSRLHRPDTEPIEPEVGARNAIGDNVDDIWNTAEESVEAEPDDDELQVVDGEVVDPLAEGEDADGEEGEGDEYENNDQPDEHHYPGQ